MQGTLAFISKYSNKHKHMILIVPKENRVKLLDHFSAQDRDIPVGSTADVVLNINSWQELLPQHHA